MKNTLLNVRKVCEYDMCRFKLQLREYIRINHIFLLLFVPLYLQYSRTNQNKTSCHEQRVQLQVAHSQHCRFSTHGETLPAMSNKAVYRHRR